jgi:hypothetical protein
VSARICRAAGRVPERRLPICVWGTGAQFKDLLGRNATNNQLHGVISWGDGQSCDELHSTVLSISRHATFGHVIQRITVGQVGEAPPNPSLESGLSTAGRLARAMRRGHDARRGQAVLPRPAAQLER